MAQVSAPRLRYSAKKNSIVMLNARLSVPSVIHARVQCHLCSLCCSQEDDIDSLQMGYTSFSENKISKNLVLEYIVYNIMKYRENRFLEVMIVTELYTRELLRALVFSETVLQKTNFCTVKKIAYDRELFHVYRWRTSY